MTVAMESIEMEPQMNADERRLITSAHRKGRKDSKAQPHYLHIFIDKHPRYRTRMTRIGRIFTDNLISGYQCHPRNPCSITFTTEGKNSYHWLISLLT
jgi:hypothetical protein